MVVLDNSTTGMTGFQPHPGASGDVANDVKIEDIARAGGVKFVEVVDAFDLPKLISVLEKAIRFDGPAVVVSRRLCNIIDQREKRKTGAKTVPYEVDKSEVRRRQRARLPGHLPPAHRYPGLRRGR